MPTTVPGTKIMFIFVELNNDKWEKLAPNKRITFINGEEKAALGMVWPQAPTPFCTESRPQSCWWLETVSWLHSPQLICKSFLEGDWVVHPQGYHVALSQSHKNVCSHSNISWKKQKSDTEINMGRDSGLRQLWLKISLQISQEDMTQWTHF